jgi:archaellin
LEFPAGAFTSDFVTVQVIPPEGAPISVDFDLTRLR